MTTDDEQGDALAPGMQDPWRSNDADPGAHGQDPAATIRTGESGPQGGQLGTAGGGYGSGSAAGTAGGPPDGTDVQLHSGPGPQTEWLRGGSGVPHEDAGTERPVGYDGEGQPVGFESHGIRPPMGDVAERPVRNLTIDAREEQLADTSTNDPSPSSGKAEDDEHRRDLPNAEPASGGGS